MVPVIVPAEGSTTTLAVPVMPDEKAAAPASTTVCLSLRNVSRETCGDVTVGEATLSPLDFWQAVKESNASDQRQHKRAIPVLFGAVLDFFRFMVYSLAIKI
jgi:hypothetical protein